MCSMFCVLHVLVWNETSQMFDLFSEWISNTCPRHTHTHTHTHTLTHTHTHSHTCICTVRWNTLRKIKTVISDGWIDERWRFVFLFPSSSHLSRNGTARRSVCSSTVPPPPPPPPTQHTITHTHSHTQTHTHRNTDLHIVLNSSPTHVCSERRRETWQFTVTSSSRHHHIHPHIILLPPPAGQVGEGNEDNVAHLWNVCVDVRGWLICWYLTEMINEETYFVSYNTIKP